MFTLAKLRELPPRTRLRKVARILQGIEVEMAGGRAPDRDYLSRLLESLNAQPPGAGQDALALQGALERDGDTAEILRGLNSLRHGLLRTLQAEPAEWDLVSADSGLLDRADVRVLPFSVYLEDMRSPFNVGAIFRTAEAFGAERILLSPRTPLPTHPRAERTARGASMAVPWEVAEIDSLRGNRAVFALELGGTPLDRFSFPPQGIVLVGSEELGLSPEALSIADQALGRVSIPLAGAKRSLNVSVAFGILMQAWHARVARAAG